MTRRALEAFQVPGQVHRNEDFHVSVMQGLVLREAFSAGKGGDRHLSQGAKSTVEATQSYERPGALLLDVGFCFIG